MLLSQRVRIYPNKTMQKEFEKMFNYARYSYNAGLELWNELYKAGGNPTDWTVRTTYKRTMKKDWEDEFSSTIFDNAIAHLSRAWKSFFEGNSGLPRFKDKKTSKPSFTFNRKNPYTIRIKNGRLYLPRFKYGVKLSEPIRFGGLIKTVTINKRANCYFASFSIDIPADSIKYRSDKSLPTVGIDSNIGHYDISEELHRWETPLRRIEKYYQRISYYQRRMDKKVYKSGNYETMRVKLQRLHLRVQNIQDDWLHKFTTHIVRNYHVICIEDLDVSQMLKNRRISKHVGRSLFYRFREFLTYKSKLYGNTLIVADMWYPSTQRCSSCGNIKKGKDKLSLKNRVYRCSECGFKSDRDYNSALNLKQYAHSVVNA